MNARGQSRTGLGALLPLLLAGLVTSHAAHAAADFAGIWLADPLQARRWASALPFTEAGRRQVEEYRRTHDPQIDDPGKFCVPPGMPTAMTSIAEYPLEILQSARQVTVLLELHWQQRRIYLDRRTPPAPLVPSAMGYSSGRWEGDTLVIETRALKPALFWAVPRGAQTSIVERWKKSADGRSIEIDITVNDPVLYATPITAHQVLRQAPAGTAMMEYDCTEAAWEDHLAERAAQSSP